MNPDNKIELTDFDDQAHVRDVVNSLATAVDVINSSKLNAVIPVLSVDDEFKEKHVKPLEFDVGISDSSVDSSTLPNTTDSSVVGAVSVVKKEVPDGLNPSIEQQTLLSTMADCSSLVGQGLADKQIKAKEDVDEESVECPFVVSRTKLSGESDVILLQPRPLVPYDTESSESEDSESDSESDSLSEVSSSSDSVSLISSSSEESSEESDDDKPEPTNKSARFKKTTTKSAEGKWNRYRTRGELTLDDLPPIENLHITVEKTELEKIGTIHAIVDKLVVIHSIRGLKVLDQDTYLFSEDGATLGQIFEVLGPVVEPFYSIRFNDLSEIDNRRLAVGNDVFYTPGRKELISLVFVDGLRQGKGSDASWEDNNEPPERFLEYSDDEEERKAKLKKRGKRSAKDDSLPNDDNNRSLDEQKITNSNNQNWKRRNRQRKAFTNPADGRQILRPALKFSRPQCFALPSAATTHSQLLAAQQPVGFPTFGLRPPNIWRSPNAGPNYHPNPFGDVTRFPFGSSGFSVSNPSRFGANTNRRLANTGSANGSSFPLVPAYGFPPQFRPPLAFDSNLSPTVFSFPSFSMPPPPPPPLPQVSQSQVLPFPNFINPPPPPTELAPTSKVDK